MADELTQGDVRIVQENIRVLVALPQCLQKVIPDIFVTVIPIDEGKINLGEVEVVVGREEIIISQLEVRDDLFHTKLAEVLVDLLRILPVVASTYGLEGAILQERIRWVYEGQFTMAVVVLDAEGQANHAESKAGTDDQCVARPERPDQAVIEKAEAEIEVFRVFIMPHGLRIVKNVFQ